MKKAKIVTYRPRDANGDELVSDLRAGAKGKGRVLASVRWWPWSLPSCDARDDYLWQAAKRANVEIIEDW